MNSPVRSVGHAVGLVRVVLISREGCDPRCVTREHLADTIACMARVSREDVREGADLTTLGVGSLDILRLVNDYRMRGVPVTYQELAAQPTLDAWWARISHLLRTNPYLAA